MKWIPFPSDSIRLCGLPWFKENAPKLFRLPKRARGRVPDPVWGLGMHPSGGRILFATNATKLLVRATYEELGAMNNMCRIGQMGLDLYVNGTFFCNAFPSETGVSTFTFYENMVPTERQICFYLPLYHGVTIEGIGVNKDAIITSPAPFAVRGPVVFYGTSITQGGCASHPGMSYEAILCRMLNADHVNLGFSGNGKGDLAIAELMTEIDASCYVLDFAVNNGSAAAVEKVYEPFLRVLRNARPEVPVVLVTPIIQSRERLFPDTRERLEGMRRVIRHVYVARIKAGDMNIRLVEGPSLLGLMDVDGLVDGSHPNDLGFQRMAERLLPIITEVTARARR